MAAIRDLIFVAVATALYRRAARPSGFPFAIGLGVIIGIAALGKVNIAAVGLTIATIGVVGTARRPGVSLAVFVSSAVLSFVGLWLVAGQHLGSVPAYFQTALDIAKGYSESMGLEDPQTSWSSGVALLSTVILVGLFWLRTSKVPSRDRLTMFGIMALVPLPSTRRASRGREWVSPPIWRPCLRCGRSPSRRPARGQLQACRLPACWRRSSQSSRCRSQP